MSVRLWQIVSHYAICRMLMKFDTVFLYKMSSRKREFHENRLGENLTSPKGVNEFRYLHVPERFR
jgi:hypothetical protein